MCRFAKPSPSSNGCGRSNRPASAKFVSQLGRNQHTSGGYVGVSSAVGERIAFAPLASCEDKLESECSGFESVNLTDTKIIGLWRN